MRKVVLLASLLLGGCTLNIEPIGYYGPPRGSIYYGRSPRIAPLWPYGCPYRDWWGRLHDPCWNMVDHQDYRYGPYPGW